MFFSTPKSRHKLRKRAQFGWPILSNWALQIPKGPIPIQKSDPKGDIPSFGGGQRTELAGHPVHCFFKERRWSALHWCLPSTARLWDWPPWQPFQLQDPAGSWPPMELLCRCHSNQTATPEDFLLIGTILSNIMFTAFCALPHRQLLLGLLLLLPVVLGHAPDEVILRDMLNRSVVPLRARHLDDHAAGGHPRWTGVLAERRWHGIVKTTGLSFMVARAHCVSKVAGPHHGESFCHADHRVEPVFPSGRHRAVGRGQHDRPTCACRQVRGAGPPAHHRRLRMIPHALRAAVLGRPQWESGAQASGRAWPLASSASSCSASASLSSLRRLTWKPQDSSYCWRPETVFPTRSASPSAHRVVFEFFCVCSDLRDFRDTQTPRWKKNQGCPWRVSRSPHCATWSLWWHASARVIDCPHLRPAARAPSVTEPSHHAPCRTRQTWNTA